MANANFKFSCGIMPVVNGHTLQSHEPDENGFFKVVVGCVNCPTRANVWYDTDSLIQAMGDPNSRFNICLRDGNLLGEYGHPVINGREDIPRLLRIDEHYVSHYFGEIKISEEPVMLNGYEAHPIYAKVHPTGPYGEILEKQLRDPHQNTSFSIRSLCLPSTGPNPEFEYRKVQLVVTFDAVHAPGFEMASKRYVPANEEYSIDSAALMGAYKEAAGMEDFAVNEADLMRLRGPGHEFKLDGQTIGADLIGHNSMITPEGNVRDLAAIWYSRR